MSTEVELAEELLTVAEAAQRSGLSVSRLYQLVAAGKFPASHAIGPRRADGLANIARWRASEVDAWRATRTVRPAGAPGDLFADPDGPHIRGPSFGRAPLAIECARLLGGWRIHAVPDARSFVVWAPSRGAERDARVCETLRRAHPGYTFAVMDSAE